MSTAAPASPLASGRVLLVVGPSGAGKDAVLTQWLASLPPEERPHRVRRTITRAADRHEDHEPLSVDDFLAVQAGGGFALSWQAHGLHYGVRWTALAPARPGGWVVLNGSRGQLPHWRALWPALRVVEITASPAVLAARLGERAREAELARRARLARAVPPVEADCRIVNEGTLADAVAHLQRWWRPLTLTPETLA